MGHLGNSCATAGDTAFNGSQARPASSVLRRHMPELDTLRGVAVLLVVLYHGFFWSSDPGSKHGATKVLLLATRPAWLGVHLFFVLSGFLIAGILVDSRNRSDYYS